MSKSNVFETACLALFFNATPIPDLAQNDATAPALTLTIALHTADPGDAGTMVTNEATYGGYARQTKTRDATGWSLTGNTISPTSAITFPQCTSGAQTITHWSVGTGVANNIMYSGSIAPTIPVAVGVTPQLTTATTITED